MGEKLLRIKLSVAFRWLRKAQVSRIQICCRKITSLSTTTLLQRCCFPQCFIISTALRFSLPSKFLWSLIFEVIIKGIHLYTPFKVTLIKTWDKLFAMLLALWCEVNEHRVCKATQTVNKMVNFEIKHKIIEFGGQC